MAPSARKQYTNHPHVVPRDAIYELRRARARVKDEPGETIREVVGDSGTDKDYKDMLKRLLAMGDGADPCKKEKVDENDVIEQRTKHVPLKKRKRQDQHDGLGTGCVKTNPRVIKNLVVKKEKQCDRTNVVARKKAHGHLHHEDNKGDIPLIHNQSELVARAQPVKRYRKQVGGKLKGVVKEEYEADKKVVVKKENEKISWDRSSRNYSTDGGQVQRGTKTVVRGAAGLKEVKKERDDHHLGMGGIHSRTRNAKCANYSRACKNSNGKYLEGRDTSGPDPEVEILDHDTVIKEGIFSPFIPSKKFDITMTDEDTKNLPSAKDEFRKELLEVLQKPFDIEEYKECQETIRAGPFLKHYRGVQKRLTKYRYKREKRLVIIRGFLFWIQNLTREGAFRPWKDEQCMAVQLPSS